MIKLHCLAETYLGIFPLQETQQKQMRECILKYTIPKGSIFSTEKINYFKFRIFNALKSLVRQSEWQKTTRKIYPNSSDPKIQKAITETMTTLLKLQSGGLEAPKDQTPFQDIASKMKGEKPIKEGEGVELVTTEALNKLGKCNHGSNSYWDKDFPKLNLKSAG